MPLTSHEYPILEFDSQERAILNPTARPPTQPIPERAVFCFFNNLLKEMAANGELVELHRLNSEIGPNMVYRLDKPGGSLMVVHPGVGAPLGAAFLEEVIALGGRKFIACGGCGVLHSEIAAGHPLVLTAAVRDEGVSYQYLPPSREVAADPRAVAALETALRARGVDYRLGKSWTTDAVYRETPDRRARRMAEGCDVVEMEAAAFFAVARFRGVSFGQIVYGGDLVVPEGWDYRAWDHRHDDRRLIFELAVDAVLNL